MNNNNDIHWKLIKEQLNPHFLFNSLNVLKSLISIDKEKAIQYTIDLAELLRLSIDYQESNQKIVEEIKLVQLYLSLQNQRFNSNILVNIHVQSMYNEYQIPFLSLIILVENTIKHNVISNNKKLFIHIYIEGDYLCVKNNLNKKHHSNNRKGIGLSTIQERVKNICSKEMLIDETSEYFCVKIPYYA
ncbi:MAG: histidine kinase [Flavobacteriia bacterium]|nr:histidine kinase [Flavobacteriia bacterium]